jgi:hypothetical protein
MGSREPPQLRSPSHLAWVRGHECAIKNCDGHVCSGKIEAAHVRTGTDGGTGVKPSDRYTIPLCGAAHDLQHRIGEPRFERRYRINMKQMADELWLRSPARQRMERLHR